MPIVDTFIRRSKKYFVCEKPHRQNKSHPGGRKIFFFRQLFMPVLNIHLIQPHEEKRECIYDWHWLKFSISPKRVFSKYSSAFLQYLLDTIFRLAIRITQKLRALQMLLEHVSWCPHHSSKSLVGCTPPIRKRDFLHILQYYNFDRSKFHWKNFHIRFFPLH